MSKDNPKKLSHILLSGTAHSEAYSPIPSRGKSITLPPRQRNDHGQKLLRQFRNLRAESDAIISEQKAFGIDAGNGIHVQFESEPEFELKFESLEAIRSGIELLAVQQVDNKTLATVFIPEGKLDILTSKVSDYLETDTPKGDPKNKKLVESISEIKRAALDALWTDERSLFPKDDQKEIWWEVWLRTGDDPQSIKGFFREHAQGIGLTVVDEEIQFPDRTVIAVRGNKEQIGRSVRLLNCIAELRMAKETAEFFTSMGAIEQGEWVDDLRERTQSPPLDCPIVCVLDTGINNGHPLLSEYLSSSDMHAYNPDWSLNDHDGHGTEMAGLALYGDLFEAMVASGPISLSHRLESVKILPSKGENPPHLYGDITAESIARAEIQNPDGKRVVCMAVCATDDRDRGRPSSWSARVDNLCAGSDDDFQRNIFIAAGNTPVEDRHHFPFSNMSDCGIHDPGQAWNAITVGAFTEKGSIDPSEYPGWKVVAPLGDISPCSSTSMTWQRPWPLKPDIVLKAAIWRLIRQMEPRITWTAFSFYQPAPTTILNRWSLLGIQVPPQL